MSRPSHHPRRHAVPALLLCGALALAGCTAYRPAPLAAGPTFPSLPAGPTLAVSQAGPQDRWTAPFDPSDGLNGDEIAVLAVAQNPALRSARAAARVTQAQSFAAGLLPDPQLNLTRDFPVGAAVGATSAFVLGLGYAVNTLITHGTTVEAGRQDTRQARQALLWQEWQVVAQARVSYVRLYVAGDRRHLLLQTRQVLADRYERARQALAQGLVTLDAVTPHLTALQDLNRQLHDLDRQSQQARFDLGSQLGLAPDLPLPLQGPPSFDVPGEEDVRQRMDTLIVQRPDIRALQAGYAAQDARLRVALLNQFPTLNAGIQRSRDTSNAYTRGFNLSLGLPLLNGNRGEVRLQEATRERLHTEYQDRLNQARYELERLFSEQRISREQLADVEASLALLREARDRMRAAFSARNVDALTLSTLELATLAKETERLDARQALLEQQVGLLALVGGPRFSWRFADDLTPKTP